MEPFQTIIDLATGNLSFNQLPDRMQEMNPVLAFLCCVLISSALLAMVFACVSLSMAGFAEGNLSDWARDGALIGAGLGMFAFVTLTFLNA